MTPETTPAADNAWLETRCDIEFDPGPAVPLILLLRPRSGPAQWVARDDYRLDPMVAVEDLRDLYGNACQRLVAPTQPFHITAQATVLTRATVAVAPGAPFVRIEDLPASALPFLLPSRYCESDVLGPLALDIVGNARPGFDQVLRLTDWVQEHIEYLPGTSNVPITALDVKARGSGVCRDLTHLVIALCRSISIPARMAVGFLEHLAPMDLHAWLEIYAGDRWYTFDPVQRTAQAARVVLAYGRDAADVPVFNQFGPQRIPRRLAVSVERGTHAP